MDVNEHERLSNITLGHKLKWTACSKKGYGCKWTWNVVRKDMDVNEQ